MASKVKPIPEGHHAVTPYLMVAGADQAIAFYKKAFGAVEVGRMTVPGGHDIMHAALKFGDSFLFLADVCPGMGGSDPAALGGTPVGIHLYVENVDAVFDRAVAAGATVKMPPADMFWGDRFAKLTDPFGHDWSLATHVEDVSHEEMVRRSAALFANQGQKHA
ncbi:MAG: VOC family protein [Planctomycetes bacterium]|nr:VOC family protein [Planctomycetota bacterium]